jgi:hypothetical protein
MQTKNLSLKDFEKMMKDSNRKYYLNRRLKKKYFSVYSRKKLIEIPSAVVDQLKDKKVDLYYKELVNKFNYSIQFTL